MCGVLNEYFTQILMNIHEMILLLLSNEMHYVHNCGHVGDMTTKLIEM